jgi:nicotinic acid phosphoribosyltransferase
MHMDAGGTTDPFAAKRAAMREEFLARHFLMGGFLGGTDTYKRTMWAAVPDIAVARAGYALTMRKGLPEPHADNQLIMAGHEAMLAQWFHRPLKRGDIEPARGWFSDHAATRAFPHHLWDKILAGQPGDDIYLPVDVLGFPGGQTFLPGVPCLFFEGMGGAISYLEPAMCRYFAPILQATKARVMKLATPHDAEFGLRAAPNELSSIVLLLARYVGGRGRRTSNDTAEFLWPNLFQSVGTIGHEMMCAAQSFDRSLGEAEYEMMDRFVTAMGKASLLCDLVDAETVGLENALRVMKAHPETDQVGIRVDSGDIANQCVLYFRKMRDAGLSPRQIVFENEVTPDLIRQVYDHFRKETGQEPTMLFPGAGGYWWRLVHRDTVAAAFKRSATGGHPNTKFSNDPGKESLGGYLRVYGRDDALIVADATESPQGEPLFVKLVESGRIVYHESFDEQADRADRTWGRYKRVELSPKVHEWQQQYRAMRQDETAAARRRVAGGCTLRTNET